MFRRFLILPLIALYGCNRERAAPDPPIELDPAVVAVLADPLMIDPDLAAQNRGNAAIALDAFEAVPLDDTAGAGTARAEALQMAGGAIGSAPEPAADGPIPTAAITAGQLAADLPGVSAQCLNGLRYGYDWAAKLPIALPIYPRGHVQEAAGNVACGLQTVIFTTPVEAGAVMDFYFARAGQVGFNARRTRAGDVQVLTGAKKATALLVRVREKAPGLSEVELAVRL